MNSWYWVYVHHLLLPCFCLKQNLNKHLIFFRCVIFKIFKTPLQINEISENGYHQNVYIWTNYQQITIKVIPLKNIFPVWYALTSHFIKYTHWVDHNTDIYSANYMTAVHVAKQTWPWILEIQTDHQNGQESWFKWSWMWHDVDARWAV